MTDEDDEFDRIRREIDMRQAGCQHRWAEVHFGKQYWAPGTWMFQCQRCGLTRMTQLSTEATK